MLKIWRIWKIEIWSEELVDGHQTVPYNLGLSFRGVNCLVVFPTHFHTVMILTVSFHQIHSYSGVLRTPALMLHRKRDKRRPDEPAGSYPDLTFHNLRIDC